MSVRIEEQKAESAPTSCKTTARLGRIRQHLLALITI